MLLTEHLVRCETGGIDVFTPWYKSCIERLQQIFLQVSFISQFRRLWAGTCWTDKLCGWRTEHSVGVAVGGSSTSSLKAEGVGLGRNALALATFLPQAGGVTGAWLIPTLWAYCKKVLRCDCEFCWTPLNCVFIARAKLWVNKNTKIDVF